MPSLGGSGSYGGDDPSGGASRSSGGYGLGGDNGNNDRDRQQQREQVAREQYAQSLMGAGYGNMAKATAPATRSFLDRYSDYANKSFGDRVGGFFGRKEIAPTLSPMNTSPYAEADWDVARSPAARIGATVLGGPVVGGLYNAGVDLSLGNPASAMLSGAAGLMGGMNPFAPASQMLGMANNINSLSRTVGGRTVDDLFGSPEPSQSTEPNDTNWADYTNQGPPMQVNRGENDQRKLLAAALMGA